MTDTLRDTNIHSPQGIPPLEHDEAMRVAEVEYGRLLAVVDWLTAPDWTRPTDCTDWDVHAILAHLHGMFARFADKAERERQDAAVADIVRRTGQNRLDTMTGFQVAERTDWSPARLARALHDAAPRALAGRRDTPEPVRAAPYQTALPGEPPWTIGYLLDVILTRDVWMHRIDVCRAVGRDPVLTAEHDGRIVADVVAEWARRHGSAFSLLLDGPAGGTFGAGADGPSLRADAVEFCRVLSGRGTGDGLLATRVPF